MKKRVDEIIVNNRLRPVDLNKVQQLAESIDEVGLMNPITITIDNVLVAGNHRLEAYKKLFRQEIECNFIEFSNELYMELAEIDENLMRNELHYIDRASHLSRRKEIYEEMYPETRKGAVNQYTKELLSEINSDSKNSFVKDTAEKLNVSERKVEQEIQIAKNILPEVQEIIKQKEVTKTDALKIARMKPEEQKKVAEKINEGAKDVMKAEQEIKKEQFKANVEQQKKDIEKGVAILPDGVFEVISIDPPWNYGTQYDGEGRRVANPYPEMTQEQLKELQLPSADDSVLFLWTTQKFIFDAKELLDHWGFTYRNTIVWDKEKIGMGDLFRMQCEFCLVGIKGKPVFDNDRTNRDIIREPRREHSRKPDVFFNMVDRLCVGRKLEYFSREVRGGWEVFGNDTTKF